jgi:UMF1 family MFS transporter
MVLAGFSAPVLGALTDRSSKAKRWLIIVTVICCIACAGIGFLISVQDRPGLLMCLTIGLAFVIANFTYQLGLMFYNSFLPTLVPSEMQGKVSGLGIALGYVGVLAVIWPADFVDQIEAWYVFPFGGIMFLIFSLPMFLTVPERKPLVEEPITKDVIKKEISNFIHVLKKLKHNKNLLNCLLANFLAVDAVNTAILFFTTFLRNAVFHNLNETLNKSYTKYQMFALTVSAIAMSFLIGWLTDKIGPKKSFLIAALSMGAACICGCLLPKGWLFYITVTIFGGAGLAGVWTAGRKLLADITPEGKEGEYFGLYGLTNKSSAFGTVIFAIITFSLPKFGISEPAAYRMAFLFPLVTLALSLYFLRKVKVGNGSFKEIDNA